MINLHKNNLDLATSPYVQQHKDNPIHWQEWSNEVLDYAKKHNKIIFLSVGYAACHWCHVMAQESFSNVQIALYLNQHFVCIKVDREQRPDIDSYMMNFMHETQGQGGWPLNVFITPDVKPFLAVTYLPLNSRYGLPGFLDVLKNVKEIYDTQKNTIPTYRPHIHTAKNAEDVEEKNLIQAIKNNLVKDGFSYGPQFPPHNTLLFLLHYYEQNKDREIKVILEKMLDVMAKSGLHDHLQGGFYRYCVDESWTIPHFEKMLYDQAMLLWVYSLAFKVLGKPSYKTIAEKIITCLEETFVNNMYYTAHDADTNHREGVTYIWDSQELQQHLTTEEFTAFSKVYLLEPNFEGKIHLLKQQNSFLPVIEQKLLTFRKKRTQPFTDTKYITSWNALLGIGLIVSYRSLGNNIAKVKAQLLFKTLLKEHYFDGRLHHSSSAGKLQAGEFLEDYASMLLFATYLYEETGEYKDLIEIWYTKLDKFYDTKYTNWLESKTTDFISIPAQTSDHPTPSSASLAEMAKLRATIILRKEYLPAMYKQPLHHDFFNLMASMSQGQWHIIHTPHRIEWQHLPSNSMQIYDKQIQDCYQQKCLEFKDITKLLESIKYLPKL